MDEKQAPLFVKWYAVLLMLFGLLFLTFLTAHTLNYHHPLMDILGLGYVVIIIANCVFGIPTIVWMFATMGQGYRFETTPILIPVQIDTLILNEWVQSRGSVSGYVYVLKDIDVSFYYKIGMTRHPYTRMKDFGVKLPFRTELVQVIETHSPEALERSLHRKFRKKRIRGEWFALTQSDIDYIKSL